MPRKKRTPAKFKVGDWVRVNARDQEAYRWLDGRVLKIVRMTYHSHYENNPSPWLCRLAVTPPVPPNLATYEHDVWEEYLCLEIFLTAAHQAIHNNNKGATQ